MTNPNILLIMTDQQRWDSLGCTGCEAIATPNIDRLAAEGALFENCYANATICTPSRASLLTGKTVPNHGVYRLHDRLADDQVLFPVHLQQQGYRTALIGKLHVTGRYIEAETRHPNDGFDEYEWCIDPTIHLDSPFNAYTQWLEERDPAFHQRLLDENRQLRHFPAEHHFTHWAAERTINFLEKQDGTQPFFCKMSLFDPHDPYFDYPLEMAQLVDLDKLPDPIEPDTESAPVPDGLNRERALRYFKDGVAPDQATIDEMRLGYYASIAHLDQEVGRVLQTLEARGLAENTLVIFTSDHGDMCGDHHLTRKGAWFYDACSRVPLIMRHPGVIEPGTSVPHLVQLHDLAATVLAAAGVDEDKRRQVMPLSMDLTDLVHNGPASANYRDHAVTLYRNSGYGGGGTYFDPPVHCTMFRDERYKLNVYHEPMGAGAQSKGELYDMLDDPRETHNLWASEGHRAIKEQLMMRLLDWTIHTDVAHLEVGWSK